MQKLAATILVTIFAATPAMATPKIYFENNNSFDFMNETITDGKVKIDPNFFGKYDLTEMVKDNADALKYANLHREYANCGAIWGASTFVVGLTGLIVGGMFNSAGWVRPGYAWAGGIVLLAGGLVVRNKMTRARHYLHRAVNTYNGVVYKDETEETTPPKSAWNVDYQPQNQSTAVQYQFTF
ncbi:MAG: hypothetical protein AB7P04_03795 [Bacteriovoracia bacterium]